MRSGVSARGGDAHAASANVQAAVSAFIHFFIVGVSSLILREAWMVAVSTSTCAAMGVVPQKRIADFVV
jgi:hypothetical protein